MNPGRNGENILAIGLGKSGCSILSKLEKQTPIIDDFFYIHSDPISSPLSSTGHSVKINLKFGGNLSPRLIRSLSYEQISSFSNNLDNVDCVIIVYNPGENLSSALAPLITEMCTEREIKCLSILSMPYEFEKHKHFNAGLTLTKIRQHSANIILIDNDEILDSLPRIPLDTAFDLVYSKIALSISYLFNPKVCDFDNLFEITDDDKYSLMSFGESSDNYNDGEKAVKNALHMLSNTTNTSSIEKILLFINGNDKLSTTDLASSINLVKGQVGENISQFSHNYNTISSSDTMAVLISSGLTQTKFDDYDPLANILNGQNLDNDLEYYIDEDLGLPIISE